MSTRAEAIWYLQEEKASWSLLWEKGQLSKRYPDTAEAVRRHPCRYSGYRYFQSIRLIMVWGEPWEFGSGTRFDEALALPGCSVYYIKRVHFDKINLLI